MVDVTDAAGPRAVERDLDAGEIRLHVREAGAGPLIVLLHGITAQRMVWSDVMADLVDSFRVVAVDQRGHGLSDKPATGYEADEYAGDVVELVRALGEPALVVGHSLGARNALTAGTRALELLRGVVAVEFTPYIESEVLDALQARVDGGDATFSDGRELEDYLSRRYPLIPPAAIRRRAQHGYVACDGGLRPLASPAAMRETVRGLREPLQPVVSTIACPTLLVRGADSSLVSEAALAATARLRPDIPRLVIDGADHYVPEVKPAELARAIRTFAASI